MKNLGINFVNANEAGLIFTIDTDKGSIQRRCDTIEDGQFWVGCYGVAQDLFLSSDMDFASEEGFADDGDAKLMLNSILNPAPTGQVAYW